MQTGAGERVIHLLSQTEFGADLISLMSVTTLIHTHHVCSEDSYVSASEEGYIVISDLELIKSYGTQSFSEFRYFLQSRDEQRERCQPLTILSNGFLCDLHDPDSSISSNAISDVSHSNCSIITLGHPSSLKVGRGKSTNPSRSLITKG
jgi:hypothetical protein